MLHELPLLFVIGFVFFSFSFFHLRFIVHLFILRVLHLQVHFFLWGVLCKHHYALESANEVIMSYEWYALDINLHYTNHS